jgi:hypothetical protein
MAKRILQFDELHNECGWSCISIKDVGRLGNQWYTPARALGMKLDEYVKWLVDNFHPDHIRFYDSPPNGLLLFSWDKQADMRLYKNRMNKLLRDAKFYVE